MSGGDILGDVFENNLFDKHKIMLPPKAKGKITYIAPDGYYNICDKIVEVDFDGERKEYSMRHY